MSAFAEKLRALIASATPGPWNSGSEMRTINSSHFALVRRSCAPGEPDVCLVPSLSFDAPDAALIVATVNAAPRVADLVEAVAKYVAWSQGDSGDLSTFHYDNLVRALSALEEAS